MNSHLIILLAEDNVGDVLLVREALREQAIEFEMFVAENGEKAVLLLDRLGREVPCPDLILMDLNLPGVEGPELFKKVRAHPVCSEVPIIVVTSSDSPKDRAWTREFGVSHYFRKPSSYEEYMKLGSVVREVVSA